MDMIGYGNKREDGVVEYTEEQMQHEIKIQGDILGCAEYFKKRNKELKKEIKDKEALIVELTLHKEKAEELIDIMDLNEALQAKYKEI